MKTHLHNQGGLFHGTPVIRQNELGPDVVEARQRTRWERIRRELPREPTLVDKTMGELAAVTKRQWPESWQGRPARAYLDCPYEKLRRLPGFGCQERAWLITILDQALRAVVRARVPPYPSHAIAEAARARLSAWKIPMDYPIELLSLSARLQHHARNCDCHSLADWISELAELPTRRYVRNVGPKAIAEGLGLIDALAAGDVAEVRRWIPVARNESGLSLGVALEQIIRALPPVPRQVLELNLVAGKTYPETGAALGFSAERVGQVVCDFRLRVQQRVDYFGLARTARRLQPSVAADFSAVNEGDKSLALAVLVRVKAHRLEPTWNRPSPSVRYNPDTKTMLTEEHDPPAGSNERTPTARGDRGIDATAHDRGSAR